MKKLFIFGLLLCMSYCFAANTDVGVVLLHGKWAQSPAGVMPLARELESRGFKVATPLMPWSEGREYDVDYPTALVEIDAAIEVLKSKGAKFIVVGGQSLGANGALAYAGSNRDINGVFLMAPGHVPDLGSLREGFSSSVSKAKLLIADKKADEKSHFSDINQGRNKTIFTTPKNYLSYFDPDGLGAMPKSAQAIKKPIPLLIVMGSQDGLTRLGEAYIFNQAPKHSKSAYVTINSDHLSVQRLAVPEVVKWLESLGF
jgi:esterase/lipase